MGAHSTLRVSVDLARIAAVRLVMRMDDNEIEWLLDKHLSDKLYQVCLSSEGEDDEHFERVMA